MPRQWNRGVTEEPETRVQVMSRYATEPATGLARKTGRES